MKIFRYPLKIADLQIVYMPLGYQLLSVAPGRTDYAVDLWALVPDDAPMVPVTLRVFGTGHPLPKNTRHFNFLGTVVLSDELVWHCFEEPDPMSVKP